METKFKVKMRVRQLVLYATLATLSHAVLRQAQAERRRNRRRWWVRPTYEDRAKYGFYETTFRVMKARDPEMFMKATRMSVECFNLLLRLVGDNLKKFSMRTPISAECRLALTLM